ncbi:MAG: glycosyltransferase family 39 protein [Chloroflexi bacterium]|nr:glycosyltransferase family 39 protein [Chloroflexota bacterium]
MPRSLKSFYPLSLYLLAIVLRFIVLTHFAANDPYFYDLQVGDDNLVYEQQAQGLLAGTWPSTAFYFQPAYPFYLAGLHLLVGPSLYNVRAAQAVAGALGVLLCFWLTRKLFGQRAAWIAGALYAVYPVFIFYDLSILTASPTVLLCMACLVAFHKLAETKGWLWVVVGGLLIGLSAGMHPLMLLVAPVGALWLVWKDWRRSLPLAIGLTVVSAIAIAPYSLWNYHFNRSFSLISTSGPVNFFVGNSRTAAGIGESNLSWLAFRADLRLGRTDYIPAALEDIRGDPGRWAQLLGRKFALAWANAEVANNVSFYEAQTYSPLLAAIPVGFSLVGGLALAGLWFQRRSAASWMLFATALMLALGMCLGAVLSRLRVPMVPPLIVLAGAALSTLLSEWRQYKKIAPPLLVAALIMWGLDTLTGLLPRPPLARALPPGYHAIGDVGAATVYVPDSLPTLQPGVPYWVPVYWQANGSFDRNYKTLVQVIDGNGQKWTQGDNIAGQTGFPYYQTSRWKPGDIIIDRFLIIPPDDLPTPFSAQIWLGLYDPDTGERLPVSSPDGVLKTQLIAATTAEPLAVPAEAQPVNAKVGPATLVAYQTQLNTLTLTLYWQSGGPMTEDGVIFVHVFDASGQFVFGADSRPRGGLYSTQVWQAGEGIVDEHALGLPADLQPGQYTIKVGMYDSASLNRLAAQTANGEMAVDGVLTLGTFVVQK